MKSFAQNQLFYLLFISLLMMSSCVKEMDFDGAKDITLEPTMEIRLMEAGVTTEEVVARIEENAKKAGLPKPYPNSLYQDGLPKITNKAPVDLTSEERIVKYLDSTTLDFTIINTTPRVITIKVSLQVDNGDEIDSFEEDLPALTPTPVVVTKNFHSKDRIDQIKKLTHVEVEITVKAGADLRTNSTGKFELTSNGIFNFKYDVSDGLP